MFSFLRKPAARWLTVVLLLEAVAFYSYPKTERRPLSRPLSEIPSVYKGWRMVSESRMGTDVAELLKADETINRVYANEQGQFVSVFVAFFQTQRTGAMPHSPTVCLPGSGWIPLQHTRRPMVLSSERKPITVNEYIVGRGETRSLVVYWYQTPFRVIANEYAAKFFTIVDGIRYLRSDTSLVRLIVNSSEEDLPAKRALIESFANDFYPALKERLPQK